MPSRDSMEPTNDRWILLASILARVAFRWISKECNHLSCLAHVDACMGMQGIPVWLTNHRDPGAISVMVRA